MEEDPVLLADDRRHALLALTPLGRSVLAEFARQADYTKYVVHQVTRGKNPRAILRNPNTGAWMEMDKLPPGYEVQEGRVVKSQQASPPAVGQPSTPSATSGLADRLANLKTLGDASSHPQLSYDDLEKAARHQFQGLHRDDARQLALQMGIHGVKSSKEAQDKVVGLIHGRKGMAERLSVIDRPGYGNQEKNPHAQAALPRAQELVQEAKGTNEATAKNPLQSQQAKVQEATTGVQPPTPQDLRRITQENNQKAQALQAMQQHLDKANEHQGMAQKHLAMGQSLLNLARHYDQQNHPRADEVLKTAQRNARQAEEHLGKRQEHLEKAQEHARQAGVPEPQLATVAPVLPSEKPVTPATNQDELLHQADRLDQQARLHDMEAVIKRAGPRQPVSALTPGDAALTQDWTPEQHLQHAVLLRDMARKTREEVSRTPVDPSAVPAGSTRDDLLQRMSTSLAQRNQHEQLRQAAEERTQQATAKVYAEQDPARREAFLQVAKGHEAQAEWHRQVRDSNHREAIKYAEKAGVLEPFRPQRLPKVDSYDGLTHQERVRRGQLLKVDNLTQEARSHELEAFIKRQGQRQPVSALPPEDANLTREWTPEQHLQQAALLRDRAKKTREEVTEPAPTSAPKVDMPSHADVLAKVHELHSGQMLHVAGVNIRKEDWDYYIVQGGGVMSHHSSPSPATSKARSLAKDLAQRPETDALKNERIMNNYLAKAREHHEKREEAAQARRNSEHQASLHEEAAKAQSLGASGGQWGKIYSLSQNQSKAAKAREKANQYREEERTHTQRRDGYLQDAKRYAMLSGNERMIPWISAEQYR